MARNTRRHFIITSLSIGFTLAIKPLAATVINTSTKGLKTGEVKIPVIDGEIPAYVAMPTVGNYFPTILVTHEIFGVHEHIKDICRRFARLGYMAIAPELLARQGNVYQESDIQKLIDIALSAPDSQVISDLDATVAWIKKSSKGDPNKLGIVGFCWGGRIVWMYADHNKELKAGASWYGHLINKYNSLQEHHPIDITSSLKVPILGFYGGADEGIPVSNVIQMKNLLEKDSSNSKIILYPNAPHGFHADYRPEYRQQAAKKSWQQMQKWFYQHGLQTKQFIN